MKWILVLISVCISVAESQAQQVPKKILIEHFTNTHCSICANRNPGFYSNLRNFPEVIHIAYHPSSPYPACILNQHNKSENDSRTNYYGIYGGTPRLVILGNVIFSSDNYSDPQLFISRQNQLSPFDLDVSITQNINQINLNLKVFQKENTNSAYTLFAAIVEDTIFLSAPNGEQEHYDVFRKSFWGNNDMNLTIGSGDSMAATYSISRHHEWKKVSVIVMIQDSVKKIIQTERSNSISLPTGEDPEKTEKEFQIYPVPSSNSLNFTASLSGSYTITDARGVLYQTAELSFNTKSINISDLRSGFYILNINSPSGKLCRKFVKQQ